ncbi:hypothetical protein HOF92_15790 [bacterium]|jgi:polyhydroxyalkanoate synthesis regulator phasin|nr:hypothetical protein [bacterium]
MKDGFKDLFHFGVGSAMLAREVVEDFVDEMIRAGRVQVDERTQLVSDFSKRAEDLYSRMGQEFRDRFSQMAQEMDLVTRQEFEELQKKVAALSAKKKTAAAKTKSKTASKKKNP